MKIERSNRGNELWRGYSSILIVMWSGRRTGKCWRMGGGKHEQLSLKLK
jgi:hypothetical protein